MSSSNDNPSSPAVSDKAKGIFKKPNIQNPSMSSVFVGFGASLFIVAVLALFFGQKIGYSRGVGHSAEQIKLASDGEEVSARNVKSLKLKVNTLENQVQTAQQERDISLTNLETLRDDMAKLKVTNLQLEQSNAFLTQVLAKRGGVELQILNSKIAPLPENAYEYRFDVGMVDSNNKTRQLTPKLTLLDEINMVEVPIIPRTYEINGIARIRGRFVMPAKFTPKQLKIELSAGGQHIEQIYDWRFGKPVADMPYSLAETPEADKRPISDIEKEQAKKTK